MVYNPDENVPI